MEKIKTIIEMIIRIILTVSTLLGIMSTILLFQFHLENYPTIIKFYPRELILLLSLIILFLLVIRFDIKYLRWIILVSLIIAFINLFVFDILVYLS